MEQKSNKPTNSSNLSESNPRYSLRNKAKKESSTTVKPTTRSEKRKINQQQENNKKKKMDTKGKQKASVEQEEEESVVVETTKKEPPVQDNSFDLYNNDNEEEDEEVGIHDDEDSDEPKEEEEDHHHREEEEDDEEEDEYDDDEISQVRRTLGLHMQGIFSNSGDIISSDSSRFKSILSSLQKNQDASIQLIALQELAEILSVSSEDNLAGYFSSDNFSKELVRIMKGPSDTSMNDEDDDMMLALAMSEGFSTPGGNPEVMLLACRCISNLLEAMPTAITSIVFHGAIRVLTEKLKSIQYIDLAEQALYALEKIAAHLPRAVVQEGGLSAALMYFDFFSIHAQRTALRAAANCMRGIDQDSFPQVLEITPTLMNTMAYSDRSVVELTCLCWVRISESYRGHQASLERAITVDLLKILHGLIPISGNANAVHPATFQDLLRIFRSISKASPQLSFELLKLGIIESFYQILTGASSIPDFSPDKPPLHIALDTKWRDSVPHIMKIIVDLLPALPKDDMFNTKRFKEQGATSTQEQPTQVVATTMDPRVAWFQENQTILFKMDIILIPLILDMYASTVNLRVRQLVTHTLVKLIHYSDADTLSKVLKHVSLSSFLSGILTRQEHPLLIIDALYQTELMIKKLPQVYHFLFEREGVLYEIESISKLPWVIVAEPKKATAPATSSQQTQPDDINTTVDESDDTTDAEKRGHDIASKKEDESEEESDEDQGEKTNVPASSSSSGIQSPNSRRLFDRHDLQALLRSRYDILQQQKNRHHHHENEKGVGRGTTRKYIIQLAQHFVQNYADKKSPDRNTPAAGSSLKEILQFTQDIMHPTDEDMTSEHTLMKLSAYLRDSMMGISSFELINSGLMKALLAYLTLDDGFKALLHQRVALFERIFVDQPDIDVDGHNALKKLVVRLQEILSRSETFEVVTPLESSSTESLRNPTSMLAKQLRLKLTGASEDIPAMYKQLMVSTHAVATFRVLEDYLLARISASSPVGGDMEDDDYDEEEEEGDQHVMIEEGKDGMDIDDADTEMSEPVVVKPEEEEASSKASTPATTASTSGATPATATSTSAPTTSKKEGSWKIRFLFNGTIISNDSTVYAAVHQFEMSNQANGNIWSSSHPITYERIWISATEATETEAKKAACTSIRQLADVTQPEELQDKTSTCSQVLFLLKALLAPAIAKQPMGITTYDFINRKLTAKMNRQLEEPLIVASACLPTWTFWLMSVAPFLFPFETRYLFIQSTSFGYSRLIARWQSLQMRNNTQNGPRNDHGDPHHHPALGRIERQKVRIVRHHMLESAIKILDLFGSSPSVLEIEYQGEEGTGMGPTLEFYASTSKEFSKHSLNMWCGSNKLEKGHVKAPHGLFPKSLAKSSSRSTKKIIHLYKALGQFIAKGLLDFRIIDIPFSPAFFKVALDHVEPTPELLMEIDPVLAKSINVLQSFIKQKSDIYADNAKSSAEKSTAIQNIEVDGATLDDLCLDFTLPGDESYALKAGGSNIPVTIHNVQEYIELLQDAIAGSGIAQQIAAFREGFNCLFAIDDLKLLTHAELVSLFGKAEEDWSYATLADAMRADHGFTMDSDPVRYLLEILSDMTHSQKRQFLQFTTGSPRLPIGGWKALRPVFTVVRKLPEEPLTANDYLPSVMTCANYFKMPAYTTKEIMWSRLLTSMKEGQNSFLLS